MNRPILSVDFDGVLHSYTSGWKGAGNIPDPPVPGALDWLVQLTDHFDAHILSARSRSWRGRRAMRVWLRKAIVEYAERDARAFLRSRWPDWLWSYEIVRADFLYYSVRYGTRMVFPYIESWELHARAAGFVRHVLKWPKRKPAAFLTIDDRAMCFDGRAMPTVAEIKAFKAWNKKVGNIAD